MADLRSATAPTLGVTNPLVADEKRLAGEGLNADAAAGGFVDVMLARLTALSHDDEDLKAIIKQQAADPDMRGKADDYLRNLHGVKKSDKAEAADIVKTEVKEKIKARVREVMSQDTTPVKDNRPQKLLKKVAEFLLKANENGEISLPKEMIAKLKDFVEKDPAAMSAGEVALVMRDLIETFKNLRVPMVDKSASEQGAVWPPEMVEAFKELDLHPSIEAGKPITTMMALRALKSLVNLAENGALSALNDKKQSIIEAIDPEHVLLGVQPADEKEIAAAKAAIEAKNGAVPQAVIEALDSPDAAAAKAASQAALPVQALSEAKADKGKVALDVQAAIAAAPAADPKVALTAAMEATVKKASAKESASQALDKGMMNAKFDKVAPRNEAPVAQPMRADAVQAVATAKPFEALTQAPVSHAAPVTDIASVSGEGMSTRFGATAAQTAVKVAHLPPSPATQQVMVQIQQKLNGGSQLSVQLTPVELGRVDVRVTIKADGVAQTVVTVDRPETLSLLQKDASHLERALQQAGLNANQENMSFNLREQRQAQQGFGQHRKRALRDGDDMKIQELALNVHDGRIISDNRVNYHA